MLNSFPTFEDSPAFKWFPRPKDGLIKGKDVRFYWAYTDLHPIRITHLAVSYFPLDKLREIEGHEEHPLWRVHSAVFNSKVFPDSSGNCISGWMQGGNVMPPPPHDEESGSRFGYSPDGDFASLKAFGFESIEAATNALEQFAHIEECGWARDGRIDPAALVKANIQDDVIARQLKEIEEDIQDYECRQKEKRFVSLVREKIQSGELIVPDGFGITPDGGSYYALARALPYSSKCPAYNFCQTWKELKRSVFGDVP